MRYCSLWGPVQLEESSNGPSNCLTKLRSCITTMTTFMRHNFPCYWWFTTLWCSTHAPAAYSLSCRVNCVTWKTETTNQVFWESCSRGSRCHCRSKHSGLHALFLQPGTKQVSGISLPIKCVKGNLMTQPHPWCN